MIGDLENIFAEKKDPSLLQAVRNILLLQRFVFHKLLLNTLCEELLVGVLQLFPVFHEFCETKTRYSSARGQGLLTYLCTMIRL